jgi:hypothetical protein
MTEFRNSIDKIRTGGVVHGEGNCMLIIHNLSRKSLNLVIHGTEVNMVKAMRVRRYKRLKLIKGTYVLEAWLSSGRIVISAVNIPHISIEKITSRKDVSIRGRKIVADFVNNRAKLEIRSEPTAGDLVQNI